MRPPSWRTRVACAPLIGMRYAKPISNPGCLRASGIFCICLLMLSNHCSFIKLNQSPVSRKYKFLNKEGLYFVSFATVNWIDVFTRPVYNEVITESLTYCKNNLGMEIYCWCIMPSHIHLIYRARDNNPEVILGGFKEFTAKKLVKEIEGNIQESR